MVDGECVVGEVPVASHTVAFLLTVESVLEVARNRSKVNSPDGNITSGDDVAFGEIRK